MRLQFTEEDILEAGVAEIIGREELKKNLKSRQTLRVKFGIDPTSPYIHVGRSIPIWRLRAFQELGHEIHLVIGDFTGQIGDSSDKEAERPMLSEETIKKNLRTYLSQLWMILNPEKKDLVHLHYNSSWLKNLSLGDISRLADLFSVNQFTKRELIAKRLQAGSRVSLREMLYPLMQGYDSVMVKAEVEVGGTDQRFNMLAGRTLQENAGQTAQTIIMNTLIQGTDGRKMSSSWGNIISISDQPENKFGKIMSIDDKLMEEYLLVLPLCARPYTEEQLRKRLKAKENPRNLKLDLAEAIVNLYHGEKVGQHYRTEFIRVFQQKQPPLPREVEAAAGVKPNEKIIDMLVGYGLVISRSEARRVIEQGGVKVNGVKVKDPFQQYAPNDEGDLLIQIGKRAAVRVVYR